MHWCRKFCAFRNGVLFANSLNGVISSNARTNPPPPPLFILKIKFVKQKQIVQKSLYGQQHRIIKKLDQTKLKMGDNYKNQIIFLTSKT